MINSYSIQPLLNSISHCTFSMILIIIYLISQKEYNKEATSGCERVRYVDEVLWIFLLHLCFSLRNSE